MASTPNFNWPTPNDTDFVKFGAGAIRALGDAADGTVDGIDGRLTATEGDVTALQDRNLTAGDGLSGGGDLTADRSFAVDGTVVRTSGNQTIGGTKTFTGTPAFGILRATEITKDGTGGRSFYIRDNNDTRVFRIQPNAMSLFSPTVHIGANSTSNTGRALEVSGDMRVSVGGITLDTDNVGSGTTLLSGSIASNTNDRYFMSFSGSVGVAWRVSTDGVLREGTVPFSRLSGVPSTLSGTVNLTGNQTVGGEKTFTSTIRQTGVFDVRAGQDTGDPFAFRQGNNFRLMRLRGTGNTSPGMRVDRVADVTTSSGANVNITSSGNFARVVSTRDKKRAIENAEPEHYRRVLDLQPVFYRAQGTLDSAYNWSYWGFIAEDVAEVDARLALWDVGEPWEDDCEFGDDVEAAKAAAKPSGVAYDRIPVLLQAVVKDHDGMLDELQAEVARLSGEIASMREDMQ